MMIDAIDVLLKDWAEFRDRYNSGGLGYPSRAPLVGDANHALPGPRLPSVIPHRVHAVETAVRRMPPPYRATVEVGYLVRGDRQQQAALLAQRLRRRVSRHGFQRMLSESHIWLSGHLSR